MMKNIFFYALTAFLMFVTSNVNAQHAGDKSPATTISGIPLEQMKHIGTVDERFQSFNVEMCEVIGGDFWIPYELIGLMYELNNSPLLILVVKNILSS